MRKLLAIIILVMVFASLAKAESYLYVNQRKNINGSYEYQLPKLEWNYYRKAGKLFNSNCFYLSEFEGSLNYTAERSNMFALNHHSIQGEWNVGVQVSNLFCTYSIGAMYWIAGNRDNIPEHTELYNSFKGGIVF